MSLRSMQTKERKITGQRRQISKKGPFHLLEETVFCLIFDGVMSQVYLETGL